MDNEFLLVRVPVLVELQVQLEHLVRIGTGEREDIAPTRGPVRRRRGKKPVVRPRLDADLAVLWRQHVLLALDLVAQPAFEDLHVLVLRRVEMHGWLLVLELDEARVIKLKDAFERVIATLRDLVRR